MKSNNFIFSLLVLFLLSVTLASAPASAALLGGYRPIKNLTDPYVVEIAKFAVTEHNKKNSDDLVYHKVVSGQQQVVSGMNYNLIIAASHGGYRAKNAQGKYQAKVYDKPWQKIRSLTSFEKV